MIATTGRPSAISAAGSRPIPYRPKPVHADRSLMLSRPIPSNRIAYVDNGRGLLIVMMLLVHAASLCNPPLRDAIQTFWFLDIATCGFITMAGYTFGIVYGPDAAPPLRSVAN